MKVRSAVALAALCMVMSGCATVFDGTHQEITVNTTPSDARCVFARQGISIGEVPHTPGILSVQKRKYDITITCTKDGYETATYLNHSGTTNLIAGNIAADLLLTGGLSSIVDSADGADNKYDTVVNLSMAPLAGPAAARNTVAPRQ